MKKKAYEKPSVIEIILMSEEDLANSQPGMGGGVGSGFIDEDDLG